MPATLRLSLAAVLLLAAVVLPVAKIDARKASRISQLDLDAGREAARLTPADDSYVEWATHPYPISSGALLRVFLVADGLLLAAGGRLRRVLVARPGLPFVTCWPSGEGWAVLGLMALGAALRFTGSNRDLWIDEITTLTRHVRSPMTEILLQATSSNNHLLNSLLGRLSVSVFGESPWALRLPALLFGTATIPVFYALARRFSPFREAFLATLALVLSYHHVFFSQDARGYTGFLFGGLLGTLALLEALDTDSSRAWCLYVAAMLVSVVSVLIGIVLLAAQFAAVSVLRPTRRFYWMLGITAYLIAHVYALVIPDILGFVFGDYRRPEVGWRFSGELLQVVLRGLALGPAAAGVLVVAGAVAAIGMVSYWRQDRFFASLVLLPEILMLMALAGLGAAVFPRFFLFALPVAFLLFARGVVATLARFPSAAARRLGYGSAVVVLCTASVFMLGTWWRYPKQNYSGARMFVEQQRREGDAVVAVGIAGEGYRWYWPDIQVTNRVSELEEIVAHHRRVWILYAFPRDMEQRRPKLLRRIKDEFREEKEFRGMVGDGEIRVCLRDGSQETNRFVSELSEQIFRRTTGQQSLVDCVSCFVHQPATVTRAIPVFSRGRWRMPGAPARGRRPAFPAA